MDKNIKIYTDGGARGNPGPAACAFIVKNKEVVIYKASFYLGKKTNNQAEYMGVINALKWVSENIKTSEIINFYLDSQLVARQLEGIYKVKNPVIAKYFEEAKMFEKAYSGKIIYNYISREKNSIADKLLNVCLNENS